MYNAKLLYNEILNDSRITDIVEDIFDAYPDTIETFPCIVFQEAGQRDIEYSDNSSKFVRISVQVHIFTKALDGYLTTTEIGQVVDTVMKENFFTEENNIELSEVVDNIRHRVITYNAEIFS